MNSHTQQPIFPKVPEDDPASSPSSESQHWSPMANMFHYPTHSEPEGDYFSGPHTRRQGLKPRRSRPTLSPKPDHIRESTTNSQGKNSSRTKTNGSTSRSRHTSSAASAQALLVVTNEELKRRIATLESEQSMAVGMFSELVSERNSLQAALNDANTKIKLYEIQYEAARREIRTASEVIKRLEDQKSEAEAEATRQRKKARDLQTEKSVRAGWDQGYQDGFEEAYQHVQSRISHVDVLDGQSNAGLFSRIRRMRDRSSDRANRRSGTSKSQSDSNNGDDDFPAPRVASPGGQPSRHRVDSRPQSPPEPVRPPSARPPSAPSYSRPSSQGRSKTPVPRNSEIFPTNNSSPESIHPIMPGQHDENETLHPLPLYHAPEAPAFGQSVLSNLEDSISTGARPPEAVMVTTPPQEEMQPDRGDSESRGRQMDLRRDRKLRSRMPSKASTRISEYDLVSPPRQSGTGSRSNAQRVTSQYGYNPAAADKSDGTYGTSGRSVEEWRDRVPSQDNPRGTIPTLSPPQTSPPSRTKTPNQDQHTITPFLSFTSSIPRSTSLRSPRVSGGPRQPRGTVKPAPVSNSPPTFQAAVPGDNRAIPGSKTIANSPKQEYHQIDSMNEQSGRPVASSSRQPVTSSSPPYEPPAGTARTKTPLSWFRKQLKRSYSSPGVPINIEVEPPSQSPTDSGPRTTLHNPMLLSPEQTPAALPNEIVAEATRGVSVLGPSETPVPRSITITLPDNELPLGFVPTTPIIPTSNTPEPHLTSSSIPRHDNVIQSRTPEPQIFSPVPNNPALSDPFTMSPIPRAGTAPGERPVDQTKSPRSRAFSFTRWASPRLDRPISIFSDDH
ncbi:hypothetical protein VKT23_003699 [Stygiomarasmius scandens]|uniref:Uncharacterized protein n=1 Tax=Marasmiellus scandens TaxID=2682957 RepID=A0ABR1JYF7_9AGAR